MGPGRKIFIVPWGMKTTKVVVKGLRPLESDLQPTFCWFTWADEYEHVWDRSMLVLYPVPVVVSSAISLCFIYKLITSVKIDKCFQGIHFCLSLVEISDLKPSMPVNSKHHPMPSDIQFKDLPPRVTLVIPKNCLWYCVDIFWNCPITRHRLSLN